MTNTLPEASTETPLDTFGDVKAEALVHTLTDALAEAYAGTRCDT